MLKNTPETIQDQKVIYVPANPKKGFNVGYFLKWQCLDSNAPTNLFIEGNNGPVKNEYDLTKNITKNNLLYNVNFHDLVIRGLKNYVVLMPVFMRPFKILSNGKQISVDYRALTSAAISSKDKTNKRVDLQLLKMIEDTKNFFNNLNINIAKKVILVGFSDSANFAQRFAFLHPEIVNGVFIAGMNALAPIPTKEYKGEILNFPLGINDYEKITGHAFNFKTYSNIIQYFLLGDKDENSILPYEECITKKERKIIEKIYGKDMQTELWNSMLEALKYYKLKNIKCHKLQDVGHYHPYQSIKPLKQEFLRDIKILEK